MNLVIDKPIAAGAIATARTRFKVAPGRLLIDGRWRGAADGATMPTVDPTTEGVIAEVASASAGDVAAAVQAARRAFDDGPWGRMSGIERAKILFRIADGMDARIEELAWRESVDMGMPYRDARTIVMPMGADLFRFFGGLAMSGLEGGYRQSYEPNIRILTRREPLGVVAAITPFNFPLALSVSKIAPALAAGNTLVHKPSAETPLTALAFAEIALEAGLPEGVYNLLTGDGAAIGSALVKHPLIDKIAFTGSTRTGQGIIRDSAETIKRTTMELGGKSPNLVFADADVDSAVATAFQAIFWNKGEVCVAGSRLIVERPIYDEVVEKLTAMAAGATIGDPLDDRTQIGPIATKREFDKVMGYVEAGKGEARLTTGGGTRQLDGKGWFVEPTVFADATNDLKISREEIFGPVIPVIPFEGEDEAVRVANDTPYGLASGVQTRDHGRALRLADRIRAGTVWHNTWHRYHPNAPFGGYKQSGYGREQGAEALESYTQVKSIWTNLGEPAHG